MAFQLSSENIKFKITFGLNISTPALTFEDLITTKYNTLYGYALANIVGIVQITSPSNVIFHQNLGWASNDFTQSPEVDGSGTPSWSETGIALPLDSDSLAETGTYTFEYKLSVDGGTNVFATITKTIDFDYEKVDADIEYSLSCRTSELTSTDSTDYDVDHDGIAITPTLVRTHTIIIPSGAGANDPGASSDASRTIGGGGAAATDIWTGVWQTTLSTVATYVLEQWTGDDWFVVLDTITGYDSIDVECDDCGCVVQQCVANMVTNWKAKLGTDIVGAVALETKILKVLSAWMNYNMAERCGVDSEVYCTEIADIAKSENCDCSADDDTSPAHVVAWADSVASGGSSSTFAFTVNASNPTGGNAGDLHINTTAFNLFQNIGGEWTDHGSFKGSDGSSSTGEYYLLLENDISDDSVDSVATEQILKTYSLGADGMDSNGDSLRFTVLFELALNATTKTLKIYWDGTVVGEYIITGTPTAVSKYVYAVMEAGRSGTATQLVTCEFTRAGVPGKVTGPQILAGTTDHSGTIVIKATAKSDPGGAGNIIAKQSKVELMQIYSSP